MNKRSSSRKLMAREKAQAGPKVPFHIHNPSLSYNFQDSGQTSATAAGSGPSHLSPHSISSQKRPPSGSSYKQRYLQKLVGESRKENCKTSLPHSSSESNLFSGGGISEIEIDLRRSRGSQNTQALEVQELSALFTEMKQRYLQKPNYDSANSSQNNPLTLFEIPVGPSPVASPHQSVITRQSPNHLSPHSAAHNLPRQLRKPRQVSPKTTLENIGWQINSDAFKSTTPETRPETRADSCELVERNQSRLADGIYLLNIIMKAWKSLVRFTGHQPQSLASPDVPPESPSKYIPVPYNYNSVSQGLHMPQQFQMQSDTVPTPCFQLSRFGSLNR